MGRVTGPALVLLVGFSAAAAAQWKTTRWTVRCTDHTIPGLGPRESCDEIYDGRFSALASFYEQLLEGASRDFQKRGFAGPHLEATDGGAWPAVIDAGQGQTREGIRSGALKDDGRVNLGRYECRSDPSRATLRFARHQYHLAPGSELRTALAKDADEDHRNRELASIWTPAHELFHAIQITELGGRREACDVQSTKALAWIFEGSAEAAASAWAEEHVPTLASSIPDIGPLTGEVSPPNYAEPLTDPSFPYAMWHFWRSVGKELGSEDDIAYLQRVFRQPGLLEHRGVGAVDAALDGLGRSLYDLYPEVIAKHAWHPSFFRTEEDGADFQRVRVEAGTFVERSDTVGPLASMAYVVELPDLDGVVDLIVELAEEDRARENLHLIVHETRTDRRRGDARNVFREPFEGSGRTETFMVRVANVARDPTRTMTDDFEIRFEVARPPTCGFKVNVAGPRTGAFEGSARFSLVDHSLAVVLDSDPHMRAGRRVEIHLGAYVPPEMGPASYELQKGSMAVVVGGRAGPGSYSAMLDLPTGVGEGILTVDRVTETELSGSVSATLLGMGDGKPYTLSGTFEAARGGMRDRDSPYRQCVAYSSRD